MKMLLGGIVALIIGGIGLIGWWDDFLALLKGIIPIILVLGGAVGIYLGINDIKTKSVRPASQEQK